MNTPAQVTREASRPGVALRVTTPSQYISVLMQEQHTHPQNGALADNTYFSQNTCSPLTRSTP